jgi:hypothetical protein
MILWIIKWVFISTLLISLIHYLYSFFENILFVPKMRDLVKPRIAVQSPPPPPIDVVPILSVEKTNKNMETELEEFLQDITKQKTI